MKCRHEYASTAFVHQKLIQRCTSCRKPRKVNAAWCPQCGDRPYGKRGCDFDGCFNGHVPLPRAFVCCCYGPREDRCLNCTEAYGLIHVCTVATDEEIDQALAAIVPTKREHKPLSASTLRLLDQLSSGVGERSGQRGNA